MTTRVAAVSSRVPPTPALYYPRATASRASQSVSHVTTTTCHHVSREAAAARVVTTASLTGVTMPTARIAARVIMMVAWRRTRARVAWDTAATGARTRAIANTEARVNQVSDSFDDVIVFFRATEIYL